MGCGPNGVSGSLQRGWAGAAVGATPGERHPQRRHVESSQLFKGDDLSACLAGRMTVVTTPPPAC
eukprot:6989281-Prymnesium_polylepis.3